MQRLIPLPSLREGERRRSLRYLVADEALVVAGVASAGPEARPHSLTGRVRDMGALGLSLLLPTTEAWEELSEPGHPLTVVLSIPSSTITLRAEVAYCAARRARGDLIGYRVGARVTGIGDDDLDRLAEYLGRRL
jgi:hypothetical protein